MAKGTWGLPASFVGGYAGNARGPLGANPGYMNPGGEIPGGVGLGGPGGGLQGLLPNSPDGQTYGSLFNDASRAYLQGGGSQANVDAYKAANPGQDYGRLFNDAAGWYSGQPGYAGGIADYFAANNPAGSPRNIQMSTMSGAPGGGLGSAAKAGRDAPTTFDAGGRSAATLQSQWGALDPASQAGYRAQYAAADPAMQRSVMDAMGLGPGAPPLEAPRSSAGASGGFQMGNRGAAKRMNRPMMGGNAFDTGAGPEDAEQIARRTGPGAGPVGARDINLAPPIVGDPRPGSGLGPVGSGLSEAYGRRYSGGGAPGPAAGTGVAGGLGTGGGSGAGAGPGLQGLLPRAPSQRFQNIKAYQSDPSRGGAANWQQYKAQQAPGALKALKGF